MFKWIIRAVLTGCVFGIALGLGVTVKHLLTSSHLFNVTDVEVCGAVRTDSERLEKIFKPLVGQNIFTKIAPSSLLTDDPWIVRLEMKRVIPDKLVVFVEEEKEIFRYKKGEQCYVLTERNSAIPVNCEGVRIYIAELPLNAEFNEFVKLYMENDMLRQHDVTLKNGFFLVNARGTVVMGTYSPGVFADNYDIFRKQISPRYKKVYHVDVTVRGKIYVKGVSNG